MKIVVSTNEIDRRSATTVTQKKYQAQIYVTLRPSVLDPAGTAVESGLKNMGYDNVEGVRIGKYIQLSITSENEEEARKQLDIVCDRLLANPVIENYSVELTEIAVLEEATA